jgi:predicted transcriptional regulator
MANIQQQIKEHLESGFTITPAIAAQEYNCYYLAAIIKKIADRGTPVYRREIEGTRSKEYSLTPFGKSK